MAANRGIFLMQTLLKAVSIHLGLIRHNNFDSTLITLLIMKLN